MPPENMSLMLASKILYQDVLDVATFENIVAPKCEGPCQERHSSRPGATGGKLRPEAGRQ